MAEEIKTVVGVVDESSGPLKEIAHMMGDLTEAMKPVSTGARQLTTMFQEQNSEALKAAHSVERLAHSEHELSGAAGLLHGLDERLATTFAPLTAANEHAQKLKKTMGEIGEASGLAKVSEGLSGFAAPLAGLAAAASVGGFIENQKKVAEWGKHLTDLSKSTGTDVGSLSILELQAKKSGTNLDAVTTAMARLNKVAFDAANGGNKEAAAMFQKMHIPLRDANHQLRSGVGLWLDVAKSIQKNENATVRGKIASEAFGRSYKDLLPMLEDGREGFEKAGEEAKRTGNYLTDEGAKAAEENADAWDDFNTAVGGLTKTLGTEFAPEMTNALKLMTKFIEDHPKVTAGLAIGGGAGLTLAGVGMVAGAPVAATVGGVAAVTAGSIALTKLNEKGSAETEAAGGWVFNPDTSSYFPSGDGLAPTAPGLSAPPTASSGLSDWFASLKDAAKSQGPNPDRPIDPSWHGLVAQPFPSAVPAAPPPAPPARVEVTFSNPPPGTRINDKSPSGAPALTISTVKNVGQNFPQGDALALWP